MKYMRQVHIGSHLPRRGKKGNGGVAGPPDMSRPGTEMPRERGWSTGEERDRARKGCGKGTEMPRKRIDD